MNLLMPTDEKGLCALVKKQIDSFFIISPDEEKLIDAAVPAILPKIAQCFSLIREKAFSSNGTPLFNCFNSSHYVFFLAILRQHIDEQILADKVYYLNKALNSVDMYSAIIPDFIFFEHPLGLVIGRAQIGEYCTFYQQVGVGGVFNKDGTYSYPVISDHVIFFSGARVLGQSSIGSYSVLSTNACVVNEFIPPYSLVFGQSPDLTVKKLSFERYATLSPFILEHPDDID